jgi:hypothetical protein
MEIKKIIIIIFGSLCIQKAMAQEMNGAVIVNASAINGVDAGVFKGLQQSLNDFINQRKWTTEEYASNEKMDINFQLTIVKKIINTENGYECKLNVQASRPVYGTNYNSKILNVQDAEVFIRYVQFQPIDFNENRIVSSDALASNLSAVFAYYVYMVIGLNHDSYKLKAGTTYLTKAQNIVSNAPEGSGISGWKQDGKNNRYWRIDNLLSPRFISFREQFYNYHRFGLDRMAEDPKKALETIQETINSLNIINTDNPNTALLSLYFSAKSEEYLQMIPQFNPITRENSVNLLSGMDIANAVKYRALLK